MLPLLSIDEAARLGERLGIDRPLATSNLFRSLLHNLTAADGFYAVISRELGIADEGPSCATPSRATNWWSC